LGIALVVALGLGFLLDQELRLAWLQLQQLMLLLLQFLLPWLKTRLSTPGFTWARAGMLVSENQPQSKRRHE
jgi:hypothetical protein